MSKTLLVVRLFVAFVAAVAVVKQLACWAMLVHAQVPKVDILSYALSVLVLLAVSYSIMALASGFITGFAWMKSQHSEVLEFFVSASVFLCVWGGMFLQSRGAIAILFLPWHVLFKWSVVTMSGIWDQPSETTKKSSSMRVPSSARLRSRLGLNPVDV